MALKDWKQTQNLEGYKHWLNQSASDSDYVRIEVAKTFPKLNLKNYAVHISNRISYNAFPITISKYFDDEKSALKYAKNYMKSHKMIRYNKVCWK